MEIRIEQFYAAPRVFTAVSYLKVATFCTCERRLNTVIQFKQTIGETQRKVREGVREKRCVDLSLSVTKPAPKGQATGNSRLRSLDFAGGESESAREIVSPILLSLHFMYKYVYFN